MASPAPDAVSITRSPSLNFPAFTASSSAIGIHAEPVYPHFPITVCARFIGSPIVAITDLIVDRLTWVQSQRSTSLVAFPIRPRTELAIRGHPSSFTDAGYF